MKKLSDYKDEEAIELWADLLIPFSDILTDDSVKKVIRSGASKLDIAQTILKNKPKAAKDVLLRIDPAPLDGFNIVLRLVAVLTDIGNNAEVRSFFEYAEQQAASESSGSATENIKAVEK